MKLTHSFIHFYYITIVVFRSMNWLLIVILVNLIEVWLVLVEVT
jgi:hypothetical protein